MAAGSNPAAALHHLLADPKARGKDRSRVATLVGEDPTAWSRYCTGSRRPTDAKITKWSKLTNTTVGCVAGTWAAWPALGIKATPAQLLDYIANDLYVDGAAFVLSWSDLAEDLKEDYRERARHNLEAWSDLEAWCANHGPTDGEPIESNQAPEPGESPPESP